MKSFVSLIMPNLVKFEPQQLQAIELYASDPSLTLKEVSAIVKVNVKTVTRWMSNPDFLDNLYKRYMEVSGKELPSVIHAMINEAKTGNVQAGRLVLEHFGKLENKIKVQVQSNFERFIEVDAEETDFIEVSEENKKDFDIIAEHIVDKEVKLPPRNPINDFPKKREKDEKKRVSSLRHSEVKKVREANYQHNAYELRKRAKKVGLDLLPPGRHSKGERDAWLKKLEKLESK